jgi:hypothetical protein
MALFNIDTITASVDSGPRASRTDVDKLFLAAIVTDLEKGIFSSLGNTFPELFWDTSRIAFAWGQGGANAPDIYMQRVSASLLELKDVGNSVYLGLHLGTLQVDDNHALGGGAAATLGTIGGSGPAAAGQAQWLKITVDGTAHWVPVWT